MAKESAGGSLRNVHKATVSLRKILRSFAKFNVQSRSDDKQVDDDKMTSQASNIYLKTVLIPFATRRMIIDFNLTKIVVWIRNS